MVTVTATSSLQYRVFLNLLQVVQLVKKFPVFSMESKGSVLCPQEPSTGPYPEPDESYPHPRIPSVFPCQIPYILVSYHVSILLGQTISWLWKWSPLLLLKHKFDAGIHFYKFKLFTSLDRQDK
jgi:hypothetical protein